MMKYLRSLLVLITALVMLATNAGVVSALTQRDLDAITRDKTTFYDPEEDGAGNCSVGLATTVAATASNTDYAGRPILTPEQLDMIRQNQATYEEAAKRVDIPWQMLAVIHKNESGLRRANPGNGQGVYQFVSRLGGPYPTGPVDDAEFLRQTILAAEFLKGKAATSNYPPNRDLNTTSSADVIKDTFYTYNGRSSGYAQQAVQFGFSADTQGYEGSPYVMNKADSNRDPEVNTRTWGQVKRDHGPIEYPANNFYGAYTSYTALTGVRASCSTNGNSDVASTVVSIAQTELASGAKESDDTYLKYTKGAHADWCAYFVSWVFNEAGRPFPGVSVSTVAALRDFAIENHVYHLKSEQGFVPQPGDVAVYKESGGISHVNIVISYNATNQTYIAIGGNESSTIRQLTYEMTNDNLSGFIRVQ